MSLRSRHFIFDALATALPPFVCTYLSVMQTAVLTHTVTAKLPSQGTDPQAGFDAGSHCVGETPPFLCFNILTSKLRVYLVAGRAYNSNMEC